MLCKESKTKYYDVELFGLTAGMGIIVARMLFSCLRSLQLHTALNNERPQKTERGQYLSSISTQIIMSTVAQTCKQCLTIQGVSKKMSFLGKRAIATLKLIQNANVGGVLENSGYLLPDGH